MEIKCPLRCPFCKGTHNGIVELVAGLRQLGYITQINPASLYYGVGGCLGFIGLACEPYNHALYRVHFHQVCEVENDMHGWEHFGLEDWPFIPYLHIRPNNTRYSVV